MKYGNNLVTKTCDTNENSFIFVLLLSIDFSSLWTLIKELHKVQLGFSSLSTQILFPNKYTGVNSGKLAHFLPLSCINPIIFV